MAWTVPDINMQEHAWTTKGNGLNHVSLLNKYLSWTSSQKNNPIVWAEKLSRGIQVAQVVPFTIGPIQSEERQVERCFQAMISNCSSGSNREEILSHVKGSSHIIFDSEGLSPGKGSSKRNVECFKDRLSREQESDRKKGRKEASQRVQNFRSAPVYRTPCQQASAKVSQGQ